MTTRTLAAKRRCAFTEAELATINDIGKQPFSAFFNAMLCTAGVAAPFVELGLPDSVLCELLVDTAVAMPTVLTDTRLREFRLDGLIQVRTRSGDTELAYVIAEHKSSPERLVAVQLLEYLSAVYSWWIKRPESEGKKLPKVNLIVVYHGDVPWNVPLTFGELVEGGQTKPDVVREAVQATGAAPLPLNFGFCLIDLNRMSIETMSMNPELKAGLLALKYVKQGEKAVEGLPAIMQALVEAKAIRKYVMALLTKFKCSRNLIVEELRKAMPEEEDNMMTVEEQIRAEERALEAVRTKSDVLMRQLRKRFRRVPEADQQRIRRAQASDLDRWLDQFAVAKNLREALA